MTLRLFPLALALLLALPAQAQWVDAPAHLGAEVGTADRAPGAEGVQVHGRWTLTVRDPDGSVVQTVRFENALLNTGQDALVRLLANTFEADAWSVSVGSGLCETENGLALNCIATATTSVESIGGVPTFILAGEIETDVSGQITVVSTRVEALDPSTGFLRRFTEKFLDTPPDVAAGQSVEISFE